MKKFIILSLSIMCFALFANSQSTSVRTCATGQLCNYPIKKYTPTDATGADTIYLNPTNFNNVVYINNGDTVKDSFKITVNDTISGSVYNIRALSYFGDEMTVMFKNGAQLTDTVRFYGYMMAPSTFIASTANSVNILKFVFNGTKWVLWSSSRQN